MNEIENAAPSPFNYSTVDEETARFLKQRELAIEGVYRQALSDVGEMLVEVQERLSKKGYGCFQEWANSMGLDKNKVYRAIQQRNLIVSNGDKRELIEAMQPSLAREVARPSAPPELKAAVLAGDITSHKEYQEAIKALKDIEKAKADSDRLVQEQSQRLQKMSDELEQSKVAQKMLADLKKPDTVTVEKRIEVIPPDYEKLKFKLDTLENENKLLKLQADTRTHEDERDDYLTKASTFTARIRNFIRDMAAIGYLGGKTCLQAALKHLEPHIQPHLMPKIDEMMDKVIERQRAEEQAKNQK